jgi:hypothetical protein
MIFSSFPRNGSIYRSVRSLDTPYSDFGQYIDLIFSPWVAYSLPLISSLFPPKAELFPFCSHRKRRARVYSISLNNGCDQGCAERSKNFYRLQMTIMRLAGSVNQSLIWSLVLLARWQFLPFTQCLIYGEKKAFYLGQSGIWLSENLVRASIPAPCSSEHLGLTLVGERNLKELVRLLRKSSSNSCDVHL